MNNVIDHNPHFVTQEEENSFVMPVPKVGQPVVWHNRGMRTDRGATVRFVTRINAKTVDLNDGLTGVPHITDPRLRKNDHWRENGAWETTPYDLGQQEIIAALQKQIDDLTALITEPAKKSEPKKS
jgi:hypothetical protein